MPRRPPKYAHIDTGPTMAQLCADGLITVDEAAKLGRCSKKSVYRILDKGLVPEAKRLGKDRVIPKIAWTRFLASRVEQ